MSTSIAITMPSADVIEGHFAKLTAPLYMGHLLDLVGALVESQTQKRIHEQKTAPDGTPWPEWSEKYKATRHKNQSMLESHGDLLTSIDHVVHAGLGESEVEVGSRLRYSAAQNYGAHFSIVSTHHEVNIPARQYLGLSDDNTRELDELVVNYLGTLL